MLHLPARHPGSNTLPLANTARHHNEELSIFFKRRVSCYKKHLVGLTLILTVVLMFLSCVWKKCHWWLMTSTISCTQQKCPCTHGRVSCSLSYKKVYVVRQLFNPWDITFFLIFLIKCLLSSIGSIGTTVLLCNLYRFVLGIFFTVLCDLIFLGTVYHYHSLPHVPA